MTRTGSPCPIAGCTAHAKPGQLMCWPHWRRVPKALNHAVFDTYRAMQSANRKGLTVPADDAARSYRQARDAAIAAVEAKEAGERAA